MGNLSSNACRDPTMYTYIHTYIHTYMGIGIFLEFHWADTLIKNVHIQHSYMYMHVLACYWHAWRKVRGSHHM